MLFLVALLEPYKQRKLFSMFYDKELVESGKNKDVNMETSESVTGEIKREAFDIYFYINRTKTALRLFASAGMEEVDREPSMFQINGR